MTFRVLFIDSYDSFTYNVVELIREQGKDVEVITIHNDTFEDYEALKPFLSLFDAIVIGPGPGNPVNGPSDIGIIASLFNDDLILPILGICLGFQVMCLTNGAKIEQLEEIRHGQVYKVQVENSEDLYVEFPNAFNSVRYHSLHVVESEESGKIIPLAYTSDNNNKILMGAKISGRPWFGVQYHPESCCSEYGDRLIKNFIGLARAYNNSYTSRGIPDRKMEFKQKEVDKALFDLSHKIDREPLISPVKNYTSGQIAVTSTAVSKCPSITLELCHKLQSEGIPFFLMASSCVKPNRGEISIIAIPDEESKVFTHYTQLNKTTVHHWREKLLTIEEYHEILHSGRSSNKMTVLNESKDEFWSTLSHYMEDKLCPQDFPELPFVGGFVGILGYEMGQYTKANVDENLRPDAKLCFVSKAILINHTNGQAYTVSLQSEFPNEISQLVAEIAGKASLLNWPKNLPSEVSFDIEMPTSDSYKKAFDLSQDFLHKGDSYEICLTTQTKITPSERIEPWSIFQTLIQHNPAPFSSFFQFDDIEEGKSDLCLISTSPERFLKYSNEACELRPIKGTVKKSEEMTTEKATAILKSPKEFGENLMILDLIRNDLYEFLPRVEVKEMMTVEEYETVFQLVSVIVGHDLETSKYNGFDILKHSLPPGSMTGAPKKKTVQLLQNQIEPIAGSNMRGVYSGVTGYWSANMNGDWSVNIRCMYSYDNAKNWYIGAGGAITVLSTCDGEWQEMLTKLESALQVFERN